MTEHRDIIIGGCPRSGTTLTASLVASREDTAMYPAEIAPNFDIRYLGWRWNPAGRKLLFKRLNFSATLSSAEERAIIENFPKCPDYIDAFAFFLDFYKENCQSLFWAFKSPNVEFCLHTLLLRKRNASLIYLVRDPRDVHVSLQSKNFLRSLSAVRSALAWRSSVKVAQKLREQFPDRVIVVRYEDLVRNPESTLTFLGQKFDVSFGKFGNFAHEMHNSAFVGSNEQGVYPDAIGRFKARLDRNDRAVLEFLCGSYMEQLGYRRERGRDGDRVPLSYVASLAPALWWVPYSILANVLRRTGLQPGVTNTVRFLRRSSRTIRASDTR